MDTTKDLQQTIDERYAGICRRVEQAAERAGRTPEEIRIIGVTKMKPAAIIRVVAELGLLDIGENYAQECAAKHDLLPDLPIRWHFIGNLQRNKVRLVLPFAYLVHTVDSERLAVEIDRQAGTLGRRVPVLIQINTSGEATKHGIAPAAAPELARQTVGLPNIELRGLMTLAAELDDPEMIRPMFRLLRHTRDSLQQTLGLPLPDLSMGMTGDFEVAVEEGATMVRVGSGIFGERI